MLNNLAIVIQQGYNLHPGLLTIAFSSFAFQYKMENTDRLCHGKNSFLHMGMYYFFKPAMSLFGFHRHKNHQTGLTQAR